MIENTSSLWRNLRVALANAKFQILSVALVNVSSVLIGIVMAHSGNEFALRYRDKIVSKAYANDRAAIAYQQGHNLKAATIDFAQNLVIGAVPQTIVGLTIISPYGFGAFRGWVGGIVSVNKEHKSRLARKKSALYYSIALLLQLIPYSLAGGIGVKLGLSYFKQYPEYEKDKRYLGYPFGALRDVILTYVLVIPLFFIASLWEFLCTWN